VPAKILEQWASEHFPMPDKQFQYKSPGKPIPYEELDLERPWEAFDVKHELTRKVLRNSPPIIVQHSLDPHKRE
jgi:transaldolase